MVQTEAQRRATLKWRSKADVKEVQKAKNRERARVRRENERSARVNHAPTPGSSLPASTRLPSSAGDPPAAVLGLRTTRQKIERWRMGWGFHEDGDKRFHEVLKDARKRGPTATDMWFKEADQHTRRGRALLEELRGVDVTSLAHDHGALQDVYVQIFDLIMSVHAEVKFMEVKLHEYAPTTPLSQITRIRNYTLE
ncbi:hypothetical protein CONPUDRAFT_71443 [Coniophora puteana RWD-64-598 SS2]|uniref:Uncharacterized protein n=1 Tax=Coniophora puteana (strain RWD-64-598) TaxID=741705 RepID=A0A5M3MVI3_CONPW|nr:uncharacterized protein CONPUDRAFT_71443 [Coniophora puteana RWD-64-598 SS2]EIW82715.1 hypothetical protein CONPUDRAFT_71443 [Coniophora puteana RWD-64-598 SS2]